MSALETFNAFLAAYVWTFSDSHGTGVYASNFWDDSTVLETNSSGYDYNMKDRSLANNPIKLWDGSNIQTFVKGIGTHAGDRSNITFNIADKGYKVFEAYAGVDNEGNENSSITFKVYVKKKGEDNFGTSPVYTSEELYHRTAMVPVVVDVRGVDKIKLVLDKGTSDANDHGDWANARFYTYARRKVTAVSDIPEHGSVSVRGTDGNYIAYGNIA